MPSSAPVAVVTGGSAGVGRAVVRELAAQGFDVAVLARGRAGLAGAVADVEQAGRRAIGVRTDVSDAAQVAAAADRAESELGPVAVWVNAAFVGSLAFSWDLTDAEVRRITEVTYLGAVHGMQSALRLMRPRDRGTIVNVSSSLAHRGIPLQSAYCGAKHAIKGYTDSLTAELLHERSAVRVSMVVIPGVNTPQFDWVVQKVGGGHPQPVAPIFAPEVAARAVVRAATAPRRTTWVGTPTPAAILGNRLAPAVVDWYLGRYGVGSQTDPDQPATGVDNLFAPQDDDVDHGASGAFDDRSRTYDPVSWLSDHVGRQVGRLTRLGLRGLTAVLDAS